MKPFLFMLLLGDAAHEAGFDEDAAMEFASGCMTQFERNGLKPWEGAEKRMAERTKEQQKGENP